jgi:hypothetical protein
VATLPAIFILYAFGSLKVESGIFGLSLVKTVALGLPAMALAGAAYGWLFGRAANQKHGSWLFGMAFGFALWASGAVMVIPIATRGIAPAGTVAIGLFLSLVAWGAALGTIYPLIHHPLHQDIETAARKMGPDIGTRRVSAASRNARRAGR